MLISNTSRLKSSEKKKYRARIVLYLKKFHSKQLQIAISHTTVYRKRKLQ